MVHSYYLCVASNLCVLYDVVILSIDKSTPFDCEYSNAYNSQHQIVLYYTLTTFFNSFNSLVRTTAVSTRVHVNTVVTICLRITSTFLGLLAVLTRCESSYAPNTCLFKHAVCGHCSTNYYISGEVTYNMRICLIRT